MTDTRDRLKDWYGPMQLRDWLFMVDVLLAAEVVFWLALVRGL